MHRYVLSPFFGFLCGTVFFSVMLLQPILAASFEQIVENCRAAVHPQVHVCMQGKRGTGDRESNLAACRGAVKAIVQDCVRRETQRAAIGKPAPGAPKGETAEVQKAAGPIQTAFVAPPRTIADITAILDKERPDPAKLAELKADADAVPPKGASASDLAQFYYDRGNARARSTRAYYARPSLPKVCSTATSIRQEPDTIPNNSTRSSRSRRDCSHTRGNRRSIRNRAHIRSHARNHNSRAHTRSRGHSRQLPDRRIPRRGTRLHRSHHRCRLRESHLRQSRRHGLRQTRHREPTLRGWGASERR
jgi:hypothetical protein